MGRRAVGLREPMGTRLSPGVLPEKLDHEDVVRLLEQRRRETDEALALRRDAAPEVLYFIARQGSAAARRAIAAHPGAPAHANRLLADDRDEDVRAELAV